MGARLRDKELKSLCLDFRRGLIRKNAGDMMCGVVSFALQGYLSFLGVPAEIEEVLLPQTNHVFLRLEDGRVLDATADQFGGPKVYLGEPMWFHKTQEAA